MVKSASRVLQVLEYLADRSEPCAHSEIAADLAIPGSSLTSLLRDLVEHQYVDIDPSAKRYRLGPRVLYLSGRYLRSLDIVEVGRPIVDQMSADFGEFVSLCTLSGDHVIKLHERGPSGGRALHYRVGDVGPLHATATGKALLAHQPPAVRDAILARLDLEPITEHTITDPDRLLTELQDIRDGAMAYAREEAFPGMVAMSRPVLVQFGQPIAAIGVNTRKVDFTTEHEAEIEKALRAAEADVTRRFGGDLPA